MPDVLAPVYLALGRVYGTYQPDAENFRYGTLVTIDGERFPAFLNPKILAKLGIRYPDQLDNLATFEEPHLWTVYPRTAPDRPLSLSLVRLRKTPTPETLANWVDRFSVVAEVYKRYPQCAIVFVRYNDPSRKPKYARPDSEGFRLKLYGSLPKTAPHQVWQFELERDGDRLVIQTAHPYDAPPVEKSAEGVPSQETREAPAASVEETSPLISPDSSADRMSEGEDKEPRLDEANGKVLEPLDESSLPPVQDTPITDSTVRSRDGITPVSEPAIAPSTTTATAQEGDSRTPGDRTGRAAASNQTGSASIQQTASKSCSTAKSGQNQGQQTKTDKGKAATIKDKSSQAASSKARGNGGQVTSDAPADKANRPAFQVKVNNRSFVGYASVTLKGGMLQIDGKPIMTTKIAVVVGQPAIVEADGTLKQAGNQTVLTSR